MAALPGDTLFLSIRELGERLRRREVTSIQLTELALDRLSTIGTSLNAVATLTPELARAQAKRADEARSRGKDLGPLHGIPYGAKDLLDTKGIRTTWGAKPFENRVPDTDATVISKLEAAGVPGGPINTLEDVFADPQVLARKLRIDLPSKFAKGGSIPGVRSPITINGARMFADRAPPVLGEHTDEVLQEIGEA